MSRFPLQPAYQYPPGRIVRKRELGMLSKFILWLKNGLRPVAMRMPGVLYGGAAGVSGNTLDPDGDKRDLTAVGDYLYILLPQIYVGDRIAGFAVSIFPGTSPGDEGPELALVRVPFNFTPGDGETLADCVEVLAAYDCPYIATRTLHAAFFEPVTIERGYFYRVRVTARNALDHVYGGYIEIDHPVEN